MERKEPQLEYNLAGGLLLTLTERDFSDLCEGVTQAGYTKVCILPFRVLTQETFLKTLNKSGLTIVHIEDAWNPTPHDHFPTAIVAGLLGYTKRFLGDKTQPPIFQDALFPGKRTCQELVNQLMGTFPEARFISYQVNYRFPKGRFLLGISDGLPLTADEIKKISQERGIGLVFDPSHLLAPEKLVSLPNQPVQKSRGEWETQWQTFAPHIQVVDINPPTKHDIRGLLGGKGMLWELAKAAKELETVEFLRVEIPLPISTQTPVLPIHRKVGFSFLQEIGLALKSA